MKNRIEKLGIGVAQISIGTLNGTSYNYKFGRSDDSKVSNSVLYGISKVIISDIKDCQIQLQQYSHTTRQII